MAGEQGLVVKPWRVEVSGYGSCIYYTASRGKALSQAFHSDAFCNWSYKDFLRRSNARLAEAGDRFGEEIIVCGKPAYLVSYNRQYIQFARPGSDTVLSSHPLDVFPPEARRGTAYYEEPDHGR